MPVLLGALATPATSQARLTVDRRGFCVLALLFDVEAQHEHRRLQLTTTIESATRVLNIGRDTGVTLDSEPRPTDWADYAAVERFARDAELLAILPDEAFHRLTARLTEDQNSCVRKAAERSMDRRRRGEKDALARGRRSGELAVEYDSMERMYGALPTRKARRIVEKHFDLLVGGTVHNMRGLLTPIKHNAEELSDLGKSGSWNLKKVNQHARAIVTRIADLEQFLDDMRSYAQPLPMQRRRERLADLVHEAGDTARRHFAGSGYDPSAIELRLDIPEWFTVEVARHQILSVFTNLLRNAFEAFRPLRDEAGPFWIAVSAELEDDRVSILIEDNGVGFGEDDL
ncbi:MAG: hypothetical protein AB7I48_13125 [Planctomycetaceae bacterium]